MNKVSKILSVALVLVLALSVMVMPASAADGTIDVTYKLEKYDGVDSTGAQATDIYALTMYIDSTNPITNFTMPIYYERDKFLPVDGTDMSLLDWNYTVDHSISCNGVAYVIPADSDLADTNKYQKANATAANRTIVTRGGVSGLGGVAFSTVIKALTDQDKDASTAWWVGADPEKYGVFVIQYESANGYCNLQGYGEPKPFITFLFKAMTDDIEGAFFGNHPDGQPTVFVTETDNTKHWYDLNSTVGYPDVTVEAYSYTLPSPVYAKGSQIRFNGLEENGAKANFDVRTRAALKAEDFAAICTSEDNAKVLAAAGKLQVGFVYTAGTMDLATAKAVATGTAADGYKNVPVTYIQSTGTEYVWTCLIKNADYNASVQALGYIIVDGTPYYFDAASETTFSTLYGDWYDSYAATKA